MGRLLAGFARRVPAVLVCAAAVVVPAQSAAAAPTPAPAAAPSGGIGLRLVDAPAASRDDPRASLYIVDHLHPGTVIHRKIEVTNGTATTAYVKLYAAAATIADDTFLGAIGLTPNDLSTWTSISPSSTAVPAAARATMTVTIAVPRDAAPGEQYGVVWAETRSSTAATRGVTHVSRVGIRLYLSVGPGGAPAADFAITSLTAARSAAGQPMILATVQNTGGRALDLSGTLHLLGGPGGLSAGPFAASLGVTLAVGAHAPVTIRLDDRLPAGPWTARIKLRSGLVERSVEAVISFPAAGAAPPVSTLATTPSWRYPAMAGMVVLLLVAAVVITARRRRRPAPRHSGSRVRVPVVVAASPLAAAPLVFAAEPLVITDEPLAADELLVTDQPLVTDEPPAPRHERRRPVPERASRLSEQPMTVDAIISADYLSHLANRSLFEEETQFAMDAGAAQLCLLRIGLDDFDEINRVHGRAVGDTTLVLLAERLRVSVRPKDLTGRLGGVDFAVLFEDVVQTDINTIARRILHAVREPFTVAGHQVNVQASVGIAAAAPADDATRLLSHATDALAFARITAGLEHQWYADGMASTR